MILNAFAVLSGFVALLSLGTGVLIVVLSARACWRWAHATAPARADDVQDWYLLLFQLSFLLVGLNLASWPLFYLLLQSYVPQWPGAMCIYGVTRIGAGSVGPARFLPRLLGGLELAKPLLVFGGGAWLVLHLVNRRSRTAPLTGRVLGLSLVLGVLAVADAVAETAYLVIPKKEERLTTGCCAQAFDDEERLTSRLLPGSWDEEAARPWLYLAYYGTNVGMLAALAWVVRHGARAGWPLAVLAAGALLCLAVSFAFLVEVAAPALLHLPYHHCPYDLLPDAPESVVGMALFVFGTFAVGWGCLAGWLGRSPETRAILPRTVARLLRLGFLGYLGSLVFFSVELGLA